MKKIILLLMLCWAAFSANAQSIQELRDSMALGNLNSQVDLAVRYIYGDGVDKNWDEAFKLIQDAAQKGNRYGELWLGICYHDGLGVAEDHAEAVKWFKSSAEKGNKSAMYWLGSCYSSGDGVEEDYRQAFKYTKESADNGFYPAQRKVALFYENGDGVERDLKEAFRYFRMAADNEFEGESAAKFMLAKYYFNGWGTNVDREKARKLLECINDDEIADDIKLLLETMEKGSTMRMYAFQFRYIPDILWNYENGKVEKDCLTDVTSWQLSLGSLFITDYEWDWKDVSSSVIHPNDSTEIIVYRFPEPKETPLCLYSAAVINTKSGECAYYTLEKTMNFDDITNLEKCWVFGGMSRGNASHVSYDGLMGDVTEQQFVDFILAFLSKSHSPMGETKYPTEE